MLGLTSGAFASMNAAAGVAAQVQDSAIANGAARAGTQVAVSDVRAATSRQNELVNAKALAKLSTVASLASSNAIEAAVRVIGQG